MANGDEKEDLENQNENDPNDQVVQDHGFGTDARLWTLHQRSAPRSHHNYLQLQAYRPSDEVANGEYEALSNTDWNDNRQVEDENDPDDPIV